MSISYAHKRIMHLDMDTFFVSVERILDPSLEGKAVIVGGKPFERGVVAGCSREARVYGVHSAMPLRKAYRLCPHAVFMYPTGKFYGLYSDRITSIIDAEAPEFEKASIDEFYIDITGASRVLGDERTWCRRLKQRIYDELRLPLTYGVGNGKTVAKIATNIGKKKGDTHVLPGTERAFLAPLPIRIMPGIGEVTEQAMKTLNISTIGELAELPARVLTELFGKNGIALRDRARGMDHAPLTQYERQKSLSAEHTFMEDCGDEEMMITTLKHLAVRVGMELRGKGLSAKTITLKLRDYKFNTHTRAARCEHTNSDHEIFDTAVRTFRSVYEPGTPLRLIGIATSKLTEDYDQKAMFAGREERLQDLYESIDRIRDRYGKYAVTYGSTMELRGEGRGKGGNNTA